MVKLVIFSMKNLLSSIRRHQLGAKDLLTPTSFYQKTEQQTTLTLLMGSVNMRIPESKGQKVVHACMIRLLNMGAAKHEKVAIYAVNQRLSNVCRIALSSKDKQEVLQT